MGEKLVREALEYAKNPDALTTPERKWLVKVAVDADDETRRVTWESDDSEWGLPRLAAKGALEIRDDGVYFAEMSPDDAHKAHQVMTGMVAPIHDGRGPAAFWNH